MIILGALSDSLFENKQWVSNYTPFFSVVCNFVSTHLIPSIIAGSINLC